MRNAASIKCQKLCCTVLIGDSMIRVLGLALIVSLLASSSAAEEYLTYHASDGDITVRFDASSSIQITVWNREMQLMEADDVDLSSAETQPLEYCSKRIFSNSGKHGWLATPGFPFGYAYNTTCDYQFEGAENERIRLVFETLDLSNVSDDTSGLTCTNNTDRVVITTKSTNNDNLTVALLCSSSESQQFMSASSSLSVKFIATGSLLRSKARGFNLTYSFVTDYGVNEGAQVGLNCHFIYDSKNKMNGTLSSPNFPGLYPLDTECLYEFRGRNNEQVQIWLPVFDVEGLQQCEEKLTSDFLEIQDYSTLTQHSITERWCSRQKVRRHYRSVSNHVILKFKSNLQHAGIGFDGYYEFVSTIQTAQMISAAEKQQLTPVLLCFLFAIIMLRNRH